MDRIYGSRFELSQGADFSVSCFPGDAATARASTRAGSSRTRSTSRRSRRRRRGYGLTLLLHSLSANYNQYLGTRNQSQFGERGAGSIVITPEARGPDEFYENYGAADVFDVWADVARRFKLDPDWTVATGYSMGGDRLVQARRAVPGPVRARSSRRSATRVRPTCSPRCGTCPVLMWNNHGDELVNNLGFQETADALDALGYRYELNAFQPCANAGCSPLFPNHLQLAINDWYAPPAEFLGSARVERNPAHVTYVVYPARNHPGARASSATTPTGCRR